MSDAHDAAHERRRAVWYMLAGASVISTNSVLVKWAHVGPDVAGFYRMLFAGIALLVVLLVQRRWSWPNTRQLAWLLLPAAAFALDLMLWHRSIRDVGPGLATLLANFQVFLMALAGVLLFRERLGVRFALGLALAFAGLWLLVGREWGALEGQYRIGVVFGILTGFAYAAYMLGLKAIQRRGIAAGASPEWVLCVSSLLCALLLGIAGALDGASFAIPDAQTWGALIALGLTGQVLGWVLITRAMPHLATSLVGLLLLLQPSLSFVFDVLLFARPTQALDWLGLAISLVGIFVASQRAPAPADPPLSEDTSAHTQR